MGKLRNIKTGTIYKQHTNKCGYKTVCVSCGGRKSKKLFRIHVCVAEAFIPNPKNLPYVNHIDGDKANNNVDNLEWVNQSENILHAIRMGLIIIKKGEANHSAKLSQDKVDYIRKVYKPYDKKYGRNALARKFGVSHTTITSVINYVYWK